MIVNGISFGFVGLVKKRCQIEKMASFKKHEIPGTVVVRDGGWRLQGLASFVYDIFLARLCLFTLRFATFFFVKL